MIGWREWIALPEWGVPAVKAKIDTGARTSALHAFDLESFERDDTPWVRFAIQPWQGTDDDSRTIEAPLLEEREVTSSSGDTSVRPVVMATIDLIGAPHDVELTLTRRDDMGFRMLIGREAMRGRLLGRPEPVLPDRTTGPEHAPTEPGTRMTDEALAIPGAAAVPANSSSRRRSLTRRASFKIGDLDVRAGRSAIGELPISRLVTGTRISLPINVFHGRNDGPVLWLSAAVRGDEIAGVEIIRRALTALDTRSLSGTIVAVPIVNVHGFLNGDRYLPGRRDLNRSFPGSPSGSLAARIAHLFISEIVQRCDVGIDLHNGSDHRTNLPQIRADLDDATTRELAIAFGAPFMMHAKLRDGSLRAAATASGATVLLYEGGEAWRFDRDAIDSGVDGVGRVLSRLGMINGVDPGDATAERPVPVESRSSSWVRARRSGIALLAVDLGQMVERGQTIATVRDSVGRRLSVTKASRSGMVIGHIQQPLVNQGDALVHIAEIDEPGMIDTEGGAGHHADQHADQHADAAMPILPMVATGTPRRAEYRRPTTTPPNRTLHRSERRCHETRHSLPLAECVQHVPTEVGRHRSRPRVQGAQHAALRDRSVRRWRTGPPVPWQAIVRL